ncbi:hypothetical protein [Nocardioides mangrovi]|uniref:Right-handed parallel beta-helix repeat-containing protein n=1 Tax=Nocardioides mangrovi TaxID=2874580 RepID=A0ABS7UDB6_9ACTN|nr:hypothetical protein [Nocardioides mangrovi]MBZ5738855.1 hypothetical protein [Nocardioides mangrovi]
MNHRRTSRALAALVPLVLVAAPTAASARPASEYTYHRGQSSVFLAQGQTWVATATTRLSSLIVSQGAEVTAPDGYVAVLTVNGVETGGTLTSTAGTETVIGPGTYRGTVIVHVVEANSVAWQTLTFPERQAVYVGTDGVDGDKSVVAAARTGKKGKLGANGARNVSITSTGENFTGFYVQGRSYRIADSRITETGNGRSDFAGYGAGVVADGQRVVVEDSTIANKGAARVGILAANGANLIVKDSKIATKDGTLPSDYVSTVDLTQMRQAPWMLGIVGNVRATNLTGDDTKATYIGSDISSEGWGVLSTDSGSDGQLTSINSKVRTTGDEGYGAYAIGNATDRFLGTSIDVGTYAAIVTGGSVVYGDSTKAAVAQLDSDLDLRLSAKEKRALAVRRTTVQSDGWGVMWHGQGSADISGRTSFETARSTFLDKGQHVDIDVDGSQGASLDPGNGVLLQMMQNDDPGPVMVDGNLVNEGVYTEPTDAPTKDDSFDVTAVHEDADAIADFSDIDLDGDFYNGMRNGKNMVLTFDGSDVDGVISASTTQHAQDTITAADYQQLGVVSNTVGNVVNNGVIVSLTGDSTWTVAGTSYLSSLTVGDDASVVAPSGKTVTLTVDGVETAIEPGQTYTGDLELTVS